MFENFGQKIRVLREKEGISLNQFAKRLNVSPSYLSTLETGQRTKVDLSFLQKIEKELNIVSSELKTSHLEEFNDFHYRTERVIQELKTLEKSNSSAANYLLSVVENGLQLFHNPKPSSTNNSSDYH